MSYCNLQQLDSGKWWCPVCDLKKEFLLPFHASRECGTVGRPTCDPSKAATTTTMPTPDEARRFRLGQLRAGCVNSIRSYLDIHADCITREEEATSRLDQCLVCPEHSGTCCQRIAGTCSTKYPRWIEVICEGSCDRFGLQGRASVGTERLTAEDAEEKTG